MTRKETCSGPHLDALSNRILGASIAVHSALGPGLLESAYEACLEHELRSIGLAVERQKTMPVRYRGIQVDAGYRVDLVVEVERRNGGVALMAWASDDEGFVEAFFTL